MKVIFVDIDGVLVTREGYMQIRRSKFAPVPFDKDAVKNLNELTDKTEAVIVVSSSWRQGRTVQNLKKLFKSEGVTGKVIDKTPMLHLSGDSRGAQIRDWLSNHSDVNYVILDDNVFDMYGIPEEKILYIKDGFDRGGFTKEYLEQALTILGEQL